VHYQIITTLVFTNWLNTVKDRNARKAILKRIDRIADGTFGEYKSVGSGVSEMKIRLGKGYRLYYTIKDRTVIVLLCGGDKSTPTNDIALAKELKREL
jgi:putative addiction module killer protein